MPVMNINNLALTDVPYVRVHVVLGQLPTHLTNIFTYFIEAIFKKNNIFVVYFIGFERLKS